MSKSNIKVYGITEARRNFSKLFHEVSVEGHIVEIRKRGYKNSVYAVPCSLLKDDPGAILKICLRDELSVLTAHHLLAGVPDRFIDAQIIDQKDLDIYQVSLLLEANLPLDNTSRADLIGQLGPAFVERLEKRLHSLR